MGRRVRNIRQKEGWEKYKKQFIIFILVLCALSTVVSLFIAHKQQFSTPLLIRESSNEYEKRPLQTSIKRWNSLAEASSEIQKRLYYIMHPKNCTKQKKLYCKWNGRRCGFSCSIHRLTPCLSAAYKLQRTAYLDMAGHFDNAGGFEKWFEPLSSCNKTDYNLKEAVDLISIEAWEGFTSVKKDIPLVMCHQLSDSPRWPLPLYVFHHGVAPADIVEGLKGLHQNPGIWYTGQLAYYMIGRLAPNFQSLLEQTKKDLGYEHPIVAIHIRRGDKVGNEAYAMDEELYMEQVKLFFDRTYPDITERRVFLATDDTHIKAELHTKWPTYKFITVPSSISYGQYAADSYAYSELKEFLIDYFLLANADYTVCTFSSNVCRLQHEMKQVLFTEFDASERTMSVDRPFFYFKPFDRSLLLAVENHEATSKSEFSFKIGDFIEDAYMKKNWKQDGGTITHGRGRHSLSGKSGKYPLRKVIDYPGDIDYPKYDFL